MMFYTTGYAGRTVEQLPDLLDFYDAILVDIRFAPYSRDLQWRKEYLSLMLKDRYRHVAALGNRNFDKPDAPIQIHNLKLGLRVIEGWNEDVILMCVCEELQNCHRNIVKNELERRGQEVAELADWALDDNRRI